MLDVCHWFEKRWKKALETMAKHYLGLVAVILDILKMYIIGILLYK